MYIKELIGENFTGQNFHDVYGKNQVRISGKNKSGKSTRIKAFFWLLSGYTDANSPQNSNLFDNRVKLTPQTPPAKVKAVIVDGKGEEYTIERVAIAAFTRKRGTNEEVKSPSDTYEYYIDNIKRNATDFKAWITEHIAPEDLLRYALDGSFFIKAVVDDKKKARQLIESVVGSVTREEMKGDYSAIDELLKKYTLDEIEAQASNLAKGIRQRLNEIPALISNTEHEIAEIEQNDFVQIESEIKAAEDERDSLDRQILDLSERARPQMEAKFKAETEKSMKMEVYNKALTDFIHSNDTEIARLKDEVAAVQRQNRESQSLYDKAVEERNFWTNERDNNIEKLKIAEQKRERLLNECREEKGKTIGRESTKCPNCGAELTGDKLQQAIDRFESIRRERVAAIVAEGNAVSNEIRRLEQVILDAQPKIDAPLPEIINQSTTELENRITYLAGHVPTKEDFDNTDHGKKLLSAINAVVIPSFEMPDDAEIKSRKTELNNSLAALYERRGLKSRVKSLRAQIADLASEQKEKGAELAKYEIQVQAVKDYKQEQMEILSHKVNDNLHFSRIEVWSQQKDGTTVPDLVLKDADGVSYSTTNNASRIITAVDIQRFFCDKLNINMPCFIDESSVVNTDNLPVLDGVQTFYLFCSDTPIKIESI